MFFSYQTLMYYPLSLSAFVALTLSFICLYVFKNYFVRVGFFLAAIVLGIIAGHVELLGLGLILLFGALFYLSYHAKNKWVRRSLFIIVLSCSLAIMLAPVPGINNWQIVQLYITEDAIPYTMRFTFDKALIGLFFIWFSVYTLANEGQWKRVLKVGSLCGLAAIAVLLPLSFALGYVKFDLKLTPFFYLWALNNLIFVSIAEEAIFRGMIQQSLMNVWQNYAIGKWLALVISAMLFGAVHYKGGSKYMVLAGVAGLLYGYAYMKTRKIEASILTHFMVNSVHFVFFTYPALASAFE